MEVLIIDLGGYAVKFLEVIQDRKQIHIVKQHQVIIDKIRPQLSEDMTIEEIHLHIMESYLRANPFEGKIITQISEHYVTSRYLTLPVGNRRKAEMMIPFQLDENLPFPSSKIHTTTSFSKSGPHETKALVNIAELEIFDALYHTMKAREILPAVLTTELSLVHSYADAAEIAGPVAIVDIGYETTKCYFLLNKQVVSNHISFTAGKSIDEMLKIAYEIEDQDAVIYKHENAFFLTDEQYDNVSEDQAHFARLMKETFQPLVQDLKRWDVGFRVKYGHRIEKVLITGGTSQINNIDNFLSQALGTHVEVYNPYQDLNLATEPLPESQQISYALSTMAAYGLKSKHPLANFLTGNYLSNYHTNIPPHSTGFIAARVFIICFFLSLGLIAERFLALNPQSTQLTRLGSASPVLDRAQKNIFIRKPELLASQYKNINKQITQEINTIQSSVKINALAPLAALSRSLSSNEKIDLIYFKGHNEFVEARFSSENLQDLETLSQHMQTLGLSGLESQIDDTNLRLEISFQIN